MNSEQIRDATVWGTRYGQTQSSGESKLLTADVVDRWQLLHSVKLA